MKRSHLRSDLTAQLLQFRRLICLALLLVASVFAQATRPADETQTETLAPGIEHLTIRRGDFSTNDNQARQAIHALIVDPQRARLVLARAMDEMVGTETTSSLALRHGALAAINGGYFRTTGTYRGESVGVLVSAGKVLSEPERRRAALAIAQNDGRIRAAIASVDLKAELKTAGKSHPVSGFNRPREKNELIIFTPEFHRTTLTAPDGIEVIVERGRIISLHDGRGSLTIPREGLVLSGSGAAREWMLANLKRGARVELSTQLIADPPLPFAADFIIGGGPRLLAAGKAAAEAEAARYSESLFKQRHPRTAFGWRSDGTLVFVTVDGRQPQHSAGMTISELTELMRELGCTDAINLDGGGSTTMVISNKVINKPSDTAGERAVSDALLIFPTEHR